MNKFGFNNANCFVQDHCKEYANLQKKKKTELTEG